MKAGTRKAAPAPGIKGRRRKKTASAIRRRGGCQRLYRFAAGCGALARLAALVRSARAGDCQFDRRCPDARQCPVAAQALARSRTLMSAPVRATVPALPAATDSTNWDNVWYY